MIWPPIWRPNGGQLSIAVILKQTTSAMTEGGNFWRRHHRWYCEWIMCCGRLTWSTTALRNILSKWKIHRVTLIVRLNPSWRTRGHGKPSVRGAVTTSLSAQLGFDLVVSYAIRFSNEEWRGKQNTARSPACLPLAFDPHHDKHDMIWHTWSLLVYVN